MKYTREQQNIMSHRSGNGLVNAGAGTGKSQTLIGTIERLITSGVEANQILFLTYGKQTQADFNTRLSKHLGTDCKLQIMTFHSFGLSVIQAYYKQLSFKCPPEVISNMFVGNQAKYAIQKLRFNKVDYDDMLSMPLQLFEANPISLKHVGKPYKYLLVDELQDINKQQAKLIKLLASVIQTTLMVGDKKQSIYGFRGASVKHWNDLIDVLRPVEYSLTRSFRLPKQSLAFINGFAQTFSKDKCLKSKVDGRMPILRSFADPDAQADFIATKIAKLLKHCTVDNIAVIGRHRIPLLQLYLALQARGIPTVEDYLTNDTSKWFRIFRALVFMTQWKACGRKNPPIKSIKHVLKLVLIGNHEAVTNNIIEHGLDALHVKKTEIKLKHYRRLIDVRNAIHEAAELEAEAGLTLLIDALMPYVRAIDKQNQNYVNRELSRFKLLVRGLDWKQVLPSSFQPVIHDDGITLTTVHGAKGREWKHVFLINAVEGEFPSNQNSDEQCIFYTAITRHKANLFLLETPIKSMRFNKEQKLVRLHKSNPSSFIEPHVKYLVDYRPE